MGKISEKEFIDILDSDALMGMKDGCYKNINTDSLIALIRENFTDNINLFYNGVVVKTDSPNSKVGWWFATEKGTYLNFENVSSDTESEIPVVTRIENLWDLAIISVDKDGKYQIKPVVGSFSDLFDAQTDAVLAQFSADFNTYKTVLNSDFIAYKVSTNAELDLFKKNISDLALSGIKGVATQTNAPTPYTAETYPNGLFERYIVNAPLTAPNSWSNIVVTAADLDVDVVSGVANNRVILEVKDGVATKRVERVKGDVGAAGTNGKTTETWTAKAFTAGSTVYSNGMVWESNSAVSAADIPGTSPKWARVIGNSDRELGLIKNTLLNGDFKTGNTTAWIGESFFSILNESGVNVLTNTVAPYPIYLSQDIQANNGDKIFVTVVAKLPSIQATSAYLVVSPFGTMTGAVRLIINTTEYKRYTQRYTVSNGGMRVSIQANTDRVVFAKQIMALNLTKIYGAGNEPTDAEMVTLIESAGGYFDTLNTLSLFKADKTTVEAIQQSKADKTNVFPKNITEFLLQKENDSNYVDLSLKGTEWASGFIVVSPFKDGQIFKYDVTESGLLHIDFSKLTNDSKTSVTIILNKKTLGAKISLMPNIRHNSIDFTAVGTYVLTAIPDGDNNVLLFLEQFIPVQSAKQILYVDNTGYTEAQLYPVTGSLLSETATRTNSSWANPFKYLQNAINAAQDGDEIWVKNKVFKPTHLKNTTTYNSGNAKNSGAVFTFKDGVNVFGGFVGGEVLKTQRVFGNKSILDGDINNEITTLDPAKTKGDRRRTEEKSNCAQEAIAVNPTKITVCDGFEIRYFGNNNDSDANTFACISSVSKLFVLSNNYIHDLKSNNVPINYCIIDNSVIEYCTALSSGGAGFRCDVNNSIARYCKSAVYAGGFHYSTLNNTEVSGCETVQSGGGVHSSILYNCNINNNISNNNGGGAYRCTIYDSTFDGNHATNYGGAWFDSEVWRSIAIKCSAGVQGGGWRQSNVTDSIAFMCTVPIDQQGAGWAIGTAVNCLAIGCVGGTIVFAADTKNTAVINCEGGALTGGVTANGAILNNRGSAAIGSRSQYDTKVYNTLIFGNKDSSNVAVGIASGNSTKLQFLKNCVYDTPHPTGNVTAESDFDTSSCIQNATLGMIKIQLPSFIGKADTAEKEAELRKYINEVFYKLMPEAGSILLNNAINNTIYPMPEFDYNKVKRIGAIGIIELFSGQAL